MYWDIKNISTRLHAHSCLYIATTSGCRSGDVKHARYVATWHGYTSPRQTTRCSARRCSAGLYNSISITRCHGSSLKLRTSYTARFSHLPTDVNSITFVYPVTPVNTDFFIEPTFVGSERLPCLHLSLSLAKIRACTQWWETALCDDTRTTRREEGKQS